MGDFNRDGRPDIVTANRQGGNGSILLGSGGGAFQGVTTYAAGSDPVSVSVGDLNGDGVPDLAVANFIYNSVSIRLGNGDGSFQSTMNISTGNPPAIVIADLNGDGKPDLVTPNGQFRNTISVFLNTSPGGPPVNITQQPSSVRRCPTGNATFNVTATGSGSPTYRWQIETTPGSFADLTDGINHPSGGTVSVSGSATPTVQVQLVQDVVLTRNYRCRVTNACSTVTSNAGTLSICRGDFNCNGSVTVQDIFDFLAAWFAGDTSADVNGIAGLSIGDIFYFLDIWFAGCP